MESLFVAGMGCLEIRAIRRPKGIHPIRGLGVCKSPKRQLGSSVCTDDIMTENQDTNRTSLKSELVDPGSRSVWKYDKSHTDCRQWCRGRVPALGWPTASGGWASTSKGRTHRWIKRMIAEWLAPVAGLAVDGHRGPGEGLGF